MPTDFAIAWFLDQIMINILHNMKNFICTAHAIQIASFSTIINFSVLIIDVNSLLEELSINLKKIFCCRKLKKNIYIFIYFGSI